MMGNKKYLEVFELWRPELWEVTCYTKGIVCQRSYLNERDLLSEFKL